jgi:hypothetical protein
MEVELKIIKENYMENIKIDIEFDFRTDSKGKDPDSHSATLKKYHRFLWSKTTSSGVRLNLNENLEHISDLSEFCFASDSMIPSFYNWASLKPIINNFSEKEIEEFRRLIYSIGGTIIFPRNKVEGKQTINMARGCHFKIKDRFDLTLECIRRYYNNEDSPLTNTFDRYHDFFLIFNNFKGYVDFFFLKDLVSNDYSEIIFFLPFNDFKSSPLPSTINEYQVYKSNSIDFIKKRNKRIKSWSDGEDNLHRFDKEKK